MSGKFCVIARLPLSREEHPEAMFIEMRSKRWNSCRADTRFYILSCIICHAIFSPVNAILTIVLPLIYGDLINRTLALLMSSNLLKITFYPTFQDL